MSKAIAPKVLAVADGYQGYSLPQSELRRREGVGRNLLDRLIKSGEVDSYVLGARIRHVIMASWYGYIARCQTGTERDPVDKQRAIEAYRTSVERSKGARATKLARSGWGPDHGKRGGSKHLASRDAPSTRRPSPPKPPASAAAAPKTSPGNRRGTRKETTAHT
jgi:hypothetical protein